MGTYRFIELVGTSTKTWEDAAREAVEDAQKDHQELRVAEVTRMDLKVVGDAIHFRVRLKASFKLGSTKSQTEAFDVYEVGPSDLADG